MKKSKTTIVGKINPAVLSFTAGKDPVLDLALVEVDCVGSAAHVTMLSSLSGKAKIFSQPEKKRVVRELVAIIRQARKGAFRISKADQDVHLAVERVLTKKLGKLGKKIHTARSRNDQVAVDLRLYGKDQLLALMGEALTLADRLMAFSSANKSMPMAGRTHMQPAMPSSVGLWASAHAESLLDDLTVLKGAYDFNNRNPLGSAAGYGVPMKIDRKLTTRLLGFKEPINNVLYASSARGKCESVILSAVSQVMLSLSRLAEDLLLYSMPEFGYFVLPADFCTGSSIMPQKRNPDVLELVRAKVSRVLGCTSTVAGIINGLPGGYNRDVQETKEFFMDGIETTRSCLRIMTLLTGKMKANKKALLKGFTEEVFAADHALELMEQGMPFRDAYNKVKMELEKSGCSSCLDAGIHGGRPAGFDLKTLKSRAREARRLVDREKNSYYSAVTRLLGIKYSGMQ